MLLMLISYSYSIPTYLTLVVLSFVLIDLLLLFIGQLQLRTIMLVA